MRARMTELNGPLFYGVAVESDRIQVAVVWANLALSIRDPNIGWTILQHGFGQAEIVNAIVDAAKADESGRTH